MPGPTRSRPRETAARAYRTVRARWHALRALPLVRHARALQLRRLSPLAGGRERGEPVIRYYWHRFLDDHRADIRGAGLEIGTTQTLVRLGGGALTRADALDLAPRPGVTIVADLSRADSVPSNTYDCFIVPFTLHLIADVDAALHHAIRVLKPGGVLLASFPCVDACFPDGVDLGTGQRLFVHWTFTPLHVERLLRRAGLGAADATVRVDGNLFARVAYQMNLAAEELTARERDTLDSAYPLLVSVRAVKPAAGWDS